MAAGHGHFVFANYIGTYCASIWLINSHSTNLLPLQESIYEAELYQYYY
eukprot:UN06657